MRNPHFKGTKAMTQLEAQLEGLAIGLEQRGEKSAAHCCRLVLAEIELLRAENKRLKRLVNFPYLTEEPSTAALKDTKPSSR